MPIQNSISNTIKGSIINGGVPGADFSTKSLFFDGVDEHIETSTTYSELDGDTKLSLSIWIKPISGSPFLEYIVSNPRDTTANNSQFALTLYEGSNISFNVQSRTSQYVAANISAINYGQWNHVLVCVDLNRPTGTEGIMFINGVDETTTSAMGTLTSFYTATDVLHIGIDANGGFNRYNGYLDELAIWAGQDLRTSVATIWNNGKPADLTGTKPTSWYRAGENSTFSYPQILMPEDTNKNKVSKYSLNFDGSFDLITMGNVLNLQDDGTESYSISCWFKTTSTATQMLVAKQLNASPYNGYNLYLDSNRIKFSFGTLSGSAYIQGQSSSILSTITDGNWHHLVITYDGTQDITGFNLYYDNSPTAITALNNNTPSNLQGNADFMIGSRGIASGSYGLSFNGNIDEVAFWTTELSQTTVSSIYNNGVPTDIASLYPTRLEGYWKLGEEAKDVNTWLVPNSALSNFSKYSFNFDGVDDYVEVANNTTIARTQNISYSIWVNLVDGTARQYLVGNWNSSNGGTGLAIETSNILVFQLGDGTNDSYFNSRVTNFTTYAPNNTWNHILATWDGTDAKIYINGTLRNTWTPTSLTISNWSTFHIARRSATTVNNLTNGKLDEIALWDSGLSAAAVTAIYNGGKPKDLSGNSPISWWRMGEEATYDGTSNQFTIPDQGSGGNTGTSSNTMLLETLVGDAPQYSNAGTSVGLDIFDRHGDAPKSKNNTVSFNMEEADIVEDTP